MNHGGMGISARHSAWILIPQRESNCDALVKAVVRNDSQCTERLSPKILQLLKQQYNAGNGFNAHAS
jgi:hypothetical protein